MRKGTHISARNIPLNVVKNIGKNVYLNTECQIYKESVIIGDYTYINGGKIFYGKIGKFCSIGYGVVLGGGEHYMNKVTTYPVYARVAGILDERNLDFPKQKDCIIGNGVWIGNNVTIMQGVKVGDGAVIGSNAVITKDVMPYSVVCGVPGKEIKKLFSEEEIRFLEEVKWWDWNEERLLSAIKKGAFESIIDLKKYINASH